MQVIDAERSATHLLVLVGAGDEGLEDALQLRIVEVLVLRAGKGRECRW